jgi:hypothetical protein
MQTTSHADNNKEKDMKRLLGRMAVIGLLSSAGSMAAAPAVFAKIIVGQGIAGVNIGKTPAQVEGLLGSPTFKQPPSQGLTAWDYHKAPLDLQVDFTGDHVSGMWTASKQQRTDKGIGINSSPAQVRKAYPTAKCKLGAGPGAGPGEQSLACVLKSKYHGHTIATAFEWRNKTKAMEEIDIYLVLTHP